MYSTCTFFRFFDSLPFPSKLASNSSTIRLRNAIRASRTRPGPSDLVELRYVSSSPSQRFSMDLSPFLARPRSISRTSTPIHSI